MLPASLWHRVFRCLLLPPGSSHPDTPIVRGRRKSPWYLTATMQPPAGRNLPVKFVDPDFSAVGQHRKNVKTYGSGWALLCCSLASKRFRNLVLSFSAQHPIALVYNNLHPQWERSVAFVLRQRGLRSLDLTFTHVLQLDTIVFQDEWAFASLTYYWSHYYGCPRLQRLKLGRGKWVLSDGWAGKLKALRSLTLKHVDWSHVDVKYLATLTPQLTEFTLYEGWDLDNPSVGPRGSGSNRFCFDLSSARVLRFYFAQSSLTLFLTLSRSLKAFSAVAKRLVLSCKSVVPLYLDHLSLYGQERLVISSLRLASARVAYLNGPPIDRHSRDDAHYFPSWDTTAPPPDWHSSHRCSSSEFSWVEWLGAIARTVEVLIVRHGVRVEQVGAEWGCLRSLGIVVESEERFGRDLDFERRRDDGEEEELEPFPLVVDAQEHRLAAALSFFLRHSAHTSLDLLLNTSQDLLCLRRLLQPSARSLTSLCLDVRDSPGPPLDPAFLGEFQQLQQLELRLGSWQLSNLDPARFQALRILKIHLLESNRRDLSFLSSVAPQLHELTLFSSSIGSTTLNFGFTVAQAIAICFERQAVSLRLALPPSLKSFSASAHSLNVECTCNSPLSLDSFSLTARVELNILSLPLASAKSVYLNAQPTQNLDSQLALTRLLSSVASTVEKLIVKHDWPLQNVHVEWSCLRRLAIGVNRFSTEGFGYTAQMDSAHDSHFLKCFALLISHTAGRWRERSGAIWSHLVSRQ
ncbi:unnamed protein product [Closterium sp. Yama58-4]|nr:unnamed protein product [Closterium sp. Yama58-4]